MTTSRSRGSIAHSVLVQWRADVPDHALTELAAVVDAFPRAIPGVVGVAHGASVSPEGMEGEFDWALFVTFVDADARDGYLRHGAHAPASELIRRWSERVIVFDVAY
jgi:hypothetical protein